MCDSRCPLVGPESGAGGYTVLGPSRRQFIAQSTLAAIAAMLATGCGDGDIGGVVGSAPPPVIEQPVGIRIADYPALQQVGGIARVDAGTSSPIAVSRLGQSSFAALSMVCPHAGYQPISIVSGGFRCPNHGAQFAPDGSWTGGQRTRALQSYPTSYDASSGTLTIG